MPTDARLNLVVLRVADLSRAEAFYRAIGLDFVRHAHGKGPEHLACERDGIVFELYPATAAQPVAPSTRVGFAVPDVATAVTAASAVAGVAVVTAPTQSEWGLRAVLADPDGHRVELIHA
jgi:predicted enzyme related to lactoylglutathione lyase